jgi:predicted RNase H-like nuclease (RuvC/YqgF family)
MEKAKNQAEDNVTAMATEKQQLFSQLDSVENAIEEQMGQNEQLDQLLMEKQMEIDELRTSLEQANARAADVYKYRKQIEVLTEQVQQYIRENARLSHQVDSLDYVSKAKQMKLDTMEVVNYQNSLRLEELNQKVEIGAQMRISDVKVAGFNSRQKEITKASRIEKIGVTGTILKNNLTEAGTKTIFMRITTPSGIVITQSPSNQFEFEEKTIMFSEKKDVEYSNVDTKVEMFYNVGEGQLEAGIYRITLFCEGKEVGQSVMELK